MKYKRKDKNDSNAIVHNIQITLKRQLPMKKLYNAVWLIYCTIC